MRMAVRRIPRPSSDLGEILRLRTGRALPSALAGLALAAGLVLITPAAAQAPSGLYPDLRALPPNSLLFDARISDARTRYALRFTTTIWNAGQGPLELRGESSGDRTWAYQRIYDDGGGFSERLAG